MRTTSVEEVGSCWAHDFKGSRSCEGTLGYATCVNAVGTRGRPRKDERAFEALGSRPMVTVELMW